MVVTQQVDDQRRGQQSGQPPLYMGSVSPAQPCMFPGGESRAGTPSLLQWPCGQPRVQGGKWAHQLLMGGVTRSPCRGHAYREGNSRGRFCDPLMAALSPGMACGSFLGPCSRGRPAMQGDGHGVISTRGTVIPSSIAQF